MTLDPCQLSSNYTVKITTVKRYITERIDVALGIVYDPESVELTVDFGILTINNVTVDGLTNKIKQVFGDVTTAFIAQVRLEAIEAARVDYIAAEWTTATFTIQSGTVPRYLSVNMTFTGSCPLS